MAGGASSRMKRSLSTHALDAKTAQTAAQVHKAMIPLGKSQHPLIYRLLSNALEAGHTSVYIIVAEHDTTFKSWWENLSNTNPLRQLQVSFAYQKTPEDRTKPLGTADALYQALVQYPDLQQGTFTVCNGDNLYDSESFSLLLQVRGTPNALIAYDRDGLAFDTARIAQFAIIQTDTQGHLKNIIEKPEPETLEKYRDGEGKLRVSMNIFSLDGKLLLPFLRDCPLHPTRNEKELPQAIRNYIQHHPKTLRCYPHDVHLPDLTSAADIGRFS